MTKMNDIKDLIKFSAPAVFIASLCCIAPIVVVLLGLGSVSFAIGLTDLLDRQYQWVFILAGFVTLVISLVIYFRSRGVCTLDQAKKHRTEIINKILTVLSISALTYVIFFYGILGYIGKVLLLWK